MTSLSDEQRKALDECVAHTDKIREIAEKHNLSMIHMLSVITERDEVEKDGEVVGLNMGVHCSSGMLNIGGHEVMKLLENYGEQLKNQMSMEQANANNKTTEAEEKAKVEK